MYADPRGECVGPLIYACAAAAGAAVNVAIGIILDFYIGDGCYTWYELARDAALGAAGGPIGLYGRVGAAGASAAAGYGDDVVRAVTGLETRGIRPAPGTRVVPKGVPEGWRAGPTRGKGGVEYYNPRNPNENIRVMQGNPNSPYPNSRAPYVRQQNAAGTYVRKDGTPSPLPRGGLKDPDTHLPLDQF